MILGVDPGLAHCGWALLAPGGALVDRGVIVTERHEGEVGDAQRRLAEVCRALYGKVHHAQLVVVEWPSAGGFGRSGPPCPVCKQARGNAQSSAQTNLAAGAIAGLAWGAGRKVDAPAPVTWRAKLGHKRGADQALHADLERRYARELAGLRKGDLPHVLDAIGLALYAELVRQPKPESAQVALAIGAA